MTHICEGGLFCSVCGFAEQERGTKQALESQDIIRWRQNAELWFRLLPTGESFTSENLTEAVGLPRGDEGMNANNAVGAFMRAKARGNRIRKVGFVASRKRTSHGRTITLWEKQ